MAIVWSAASGGMYIGIEAWVKSGPDASGKVIIHVDYYIEAQSGYTHSWTYPWHWSGTGGSGSQQVTYNSANAFAPVRQQLPGWDVAVWAEFGKTSSATFNASLGPIWNGGAPSVSATVTVPARPYLVPAAPSVVSVLRVSDTQATVAFAVASSGSAPVQSIGIERRSLRDPVWRTLVWVDRSTSGSWTDTTLPSNDRCEYRVRTWNTSGYSAYTSAAGSVVSTVAAPTNVRASKQSSGNVLVEWDKAYPGGGTFTVFDNGTQVFEMPVGSAPFTFAHAASAQETHTYTIRHTDSGVSSPLSAPSNTVQLLAAPNAPKLTAPLGAVAVGNVRFQWIHNPVDSTPQQAARVRYRKTGKAWTTKTATTGSDLLVTCSAGSYEWQVQTKGLHASYSPWSPLGVFQVVDAPGVTILTPANGETYTTSMLSVSWSYYQAQNVGQTAAEIRVVENYGKPGETEIAVQTVAGGQTSWVMPTRLVDGMTYAVTVKVRSGHGLWSKPARTVFPVSFPAPPQPEVSVSWSETTGVATVQIANRAPTEGTPAAVSNTVERSIDGGTSWETVAANIGLSTTITDPECLSHGTTLYRVTATSDLPSSSSTTVQLETSSDAIWLSGGDSYTTAIPLRHKARIQLQGNLAHQVAHIFQGRSRPVFYDSRATTRILQVSASTFPARIGLRREGTTENVSTRLDTISTTTGRKLLRDYMGRRFYGRITNAVFTQSENGVGEVQVTFQEGD